MKKLKTKKQRTKTIKTERWVLGWALGWVGVGVVGLGVPSLSWGEAGFPLSLVGWCCLASSFFGWCCFAPLFCWVVLLSSLPFLGQWFFPSLRPLGRCCFFPANQPHPKERRGRQHDQKEEEAKPLHPRGGRGKQHHPTGDGKSTLTQRMRRKAPLPKLPSLLPFGGGAFPLSLRSPPPLGGAAFLCLLWVPRTVPFSE